VPFLAKKADDLFLVVALKDHLNTPPNLSHPAKTVLKISKEKLAGGALRAPTAPPGYAYSPVHPRSKNPVSACECQYYLLLMLLGVF